MESETSLENKQANSITFWNAMKLRYPVAFKEFFRTSHVLITLSFLIANVLFGLVKTLPDDIYVRAQISALYIFLGIPLVITFYSPLEVFFFRNFPAFSRIILIVIACLFSNLIIGGFSFVMDFEFARSDLPAWQRIASGTFIFSVATILGHFNRSPHLDHHLLSLGKHPGRYNKLAPLPLAPLMELLPPDKRGTLLELAVEGKFLAVRTTNGTHLITGSISKVAKDLPFELGTIIHRSYWVSFSEMDKLFFQSGNPKLRLIDGTIRPVSRKKVADIKDALDR